MNPRGWEGTGRRELYWAGAVLIFALLVWCWHWRALTPPFDGTAPEKVFAVKYGFMTADAQPVYLWMGRVATLFFSPVIGLSLLSLLGGLFGVAGVLFAAFRLTEDRMQALLCGILFALFPILMRGAVVQETGAVLLGLLLPALALLLSDFSHRHVISGVMFGAAVGVHPSAWLALPGFWYGLRTDRAGLRRWAWVAGGVVALVWMGVLFHFKAAQISGSFWGYILGELGMGYGGNWFSGLARQVDVHAYLFGWGGFAFGLMGMGLTAFMDRKRFWLLALYGLPFAIYQIPRAAGGDTVLYMVFLGPVYALGMGAVWRMGSQYLAEGLQESARAMLWVVALGLVAVQGVSLLYTDNIWKAVLDRRERLDWAGMEALVLNVQRHTRPEDIAVVIPDPHRPGGAGVFESRWAAAWHLDRQVAFGHQTPDGWIFDTVPWNRSGRAGWMATRLSVDDVLVDEALRSGRRFVSTEPFPFLHTEQIESWMSALPGEGSGGLFFLYPGWPQADDPDRVANAYYAAFETYAERGYWPDAAACLQGVIAYRPGDVNAHRKLGDLYMKIGMFESAGAIYARLLALAPGDEEVAVNLSGAYYSHGDLEQAIAVCETFLTHYPAAPEVWFNLAGYYRRADRRDDAVNAYGTYLGFGDSAERRTTVLRLLDELKK